MSFQATDCWDIPFPTEVAAMIFEIRWHDGQGETQIGENCFEFGH